MLKPKSCLLVYCDVCGKPWEHDYTPHFDTPGEAIEAAKESEWTAWKDELWCPDCSPPCVCGHVFGNHDFGEAPCEDCACQEYQWDTTAQKEETAMDRTVQEGKA